MTALSPWAFGACLYTPATREDLVRLGTEAFPHLSSLIYCTEDAVRQEDVPLALQRLRQALPLLAEQGGPVRLIRVRGPELLPELAQMDLRGIYGFVLPKVHDENLPTYQEALSHPALQHKQVMLTLETREALSEQRMTALRDLLLADNFAQRVTMLRIGGNDLLHVLGLRRTPRHTLYEGPLERVIGMLLGVFKPYGFALSSPVYEVFSDPETLAREVQQDLAYGLCGKTIIHPQQLETVLNELRVSEQDYLEAQAILDPLAPAVFSMHGRMCEPSTHSRWAQDVLERAERYGLAGMTLQSAG